MIPIYKPYLNKNNLKFAHEALDSTWLAHGPFIGKVENRLINLIKSNVITTNNGTTATHLLSKTLNKFYPNIKNIIIPNNVYIAAINSFLFDNYNYNFIIVDSDIDTWNYDLSKLYDVLYKSNLEETALLVVHNIGNIINVPKIKRDFKNLVVIEDNCEGFTGKYEDKYSGTECLVSSVSFFGNKNFTSGEGGAVFIPNSEYDKDILEYLRKIKGQGQSSERFIHDELGYNYRMTNIQAAILYGQLENYYEIKSAKIKIFDLYKKLLSEIDEVSFQKEEDGTTHSNWMFGIRIKKNILYKDIESFFSKNLIEVRPMFYPLSRHNHIKFADKNNEIVASKLNDTCVIFPSYPELQEHEVFYVVKTLKEYISKI